MGIRCIPFLARISIPMTGLTGIGEVGMIVRSLTNSSVLMGNLSIMSKFTMKTNVAMLAHKAKELGYEGQDHTKLILLKYINDNSDDATVNPVEASANTDADRRHTPDTDDGELTEQEGNMESEGGIVLAPTSPVEPTEDILTAPEVFPRSKKSLLDSVEESMPNITEFVQEVSTMCAKRNNNMEDISWIRLYDVALRVMRDCRAHDQVTVNATIAVHTSAHARRFSTVLRRVIATEFLTLNERQLRHDLWDCTVRLMRTKDYTYIAAMFSELHD